MTTAWTLKDRAIIDVARLAADFARGDALVGIVGMGYVGQPLAITAHAKGFGVLGFDIDPEKVTALNAGHSRIRTIPDARIATMLRDKRFRAHLEFRRDVEAGRHRHLRADAAHQVPRSRSVLCRE